MSSSKFKIGQAHDTILWHQCCQPCDPDLVTLDDPTRGTVFHKHILFYCYLQKHFCQNPVGIKYIVHTHSVFFVLNLQKCKVGVTTNIKKIKNNCPHIYILKAFVLQKITPKECRLQKFPKQPLHTDWYQTTPTMCTTKEILNNVSSK